MGLCGARRGQGVPLTCLRRRSVSPLFFSHCSRSEADRSVGGYRGLARSIAPWRRRDGVSPAKRNCELCVPYMCSAKPDSSTRVQSPLCPAARMAAFATARRGEELSHSNGVLDGLELVEAPRKQLAKSCGEDYRAVVAEYGRRLFSEQGVSRSGRSAKGLLPSPLRPSRFGSASPPHDHRMNFGMRGTRRATRLNNSYSVYVFN